MNGILFANYRLSMYSIENMFKALQVMLPKMKRKAYSVCNNFLFSSKPSAYEPLIAVTYFKNCFSKNVYVLCSILSSSARSILMVTLI